DVHPRAEHAGVPRMIIKFRPSLPLVVGVAAVAFNAVYKAVERATNCEAVIPGEKAPYGRWFGVVTRDRKKIHMRIAGTHCPKGIILSRHCRLPTQIDSLEHSHSVSGCQGAVIGFSPMSRKDRSRTETAFYLFSFPRNARRIVPSNVPSPR